MKLFNAAQMMLSQIGVMYCYVSSQSCGHFLILVGLKALVAGQIYEVGTG